MTTEQPKITLDPAGNHVVTDFRENDTPKDPNTVKLVAILPETFNNLVQYLKSRPIGDEAAVQIFNSLSQVYTVEGVLNGKA